MPNFDSDIVVIGAGMSGLSAAIRSGMLGKKVVLFEKHLIAGGLNSYYSRGKRNFDVGLHALTNFAQKKSKGSPLLKILRQLRISYDELDLQEHLYSTIKFKGTDLKFSNNMNLILSEIKEKFPQELKSFEDLWKFIQEFPDQSLYADFKSAREFLKENINCDELIEMIMAPCLIYGSALENDMDLGQFVIMFRALFIEGLSRPKNGIRRLIDTLLKRSQEEGVELYFKTGVTSLSKIEGGWSVKLDNGKILTTREVISSVGYEETMNLLNQEFSGELRKSLPIQTGQMSFTETIIVTKNKLIQKDEKSAIIFYNGSKDNKYRYQKPKTHFSIESAVICFPDNYERENMNFDEEGVIRLTLMANFSLWNDLEKKDYKNMKDLVYHESIDLIKDLYPSFNEDDVVFKDVFTPKTIYRYTGHEGGAVYGSPIKLKNGIIGGEELGLSLCGTDQGFLGVVGAMLSGLMVASQTCQKLGI